MSRRPDHEGTQKMINSILISKTDGTAYVNQYIKLTERQDIKETIKEAYTTDSVIQQVLTSGQEVKHFKL